MMPFKMSQMVPKQTMLAVIFKPLLLLEKQPALAYGLTTLIAVAIMGLSLSPLERLPDAPGGDKLHHFVAYGALAFPLAFIQARHLIIYLICFIALGGAIEWIQPYVNRYGEWADFGANFAGVIMGWMMAQALQRIKHSPLI